MAFGENCASQCTCDFNNAWSCDKRNGTCYCRDGWQGVNCKVDVQECSLKPNVCGNNSICQETNGSYICVCDSGFQLSGGYCKSKFYFIFHMFFFIGKLMHFHGFTTWFNC